MSSDQKNGFVVKDRRYAVNPDVEDPDIDEPQAGAPPCGPDGAGVVPPLHHGWPRPPPTDAPRRPGRETPEQRPPPPCPCFADPAATPPLATSPSPRLHHGRLALGAKPRLARPP